MSVTIIKLLKYGISSRKVAEQFGISRTQLEVQYCDSDQGKTTGWGEHYWVEWTIYVILDMCKHPKTFLSQKVLFI